MMDIHSTYGDHYLIIYIVQIILLYTLNLVLYIKITSTELEEKCN